MARHREAEPAEDARVKERPELAKAVQRQHQCCGDGSSKELRKDVHEGGVPVAVEDHRGTQHTRRVERSSSGWPA